MADERDALEIVPLFDLAYLISESFVLLLRLNEKRISAAMWRTLDGQ